MSDVRTDELSGATVVVAGSRQHRPNRPTSPSCPFCVGGTEAPEPYDVKAFVNRWPSFPDDRCEVVLYTPEHDLTFPELGLDGARRVVDLWADRTAALGSRPDVAYVLVFENRGEEVGATIAHPHGQIYAYAQVPDVPLTELRRATRGECPTCAPEDEALAVATAPGWRAWVPAASAYPYGLLLAPDVHRPDLPSLDGPQRDGLAALLVDVLARLDRLFDAPLPYMLWVHQRPTDGAAWPEAHVHVHVISPMRSPGVQRYVAAAELGSGTYVHPVVPEDAAAALRGA
ncbi:MAG: galactose-1-phosphate uridylyltransferase [Acidimicrobiales bacterium]